MTFTVILVVYVIVQMAGPVKAVQSDGWYRDWSSRARSWTEGGIGSLLLQWLVPLLGLWLLLDMAQGISVLLLFLVTVPVLLYCLGRGDPDGWVSGYLGAASREDNEVASDYAMRMGAEVDSVQDWQSLHCRALRAAGYRFFEHWFVVLFWFAVLGPLGAVFYRLVWLSAQDGKNSESNRKLARRVIWFLEWPVVRVLGFSLALAGNFSSCINGCFDALFDLDSATDRVLESFLLGALNVTSDGLSGNAAAARVSLVEVEALQPLLKRTLIIWIVILAIVSMI